MIDEKWQMEKRNMASKKMELKILANFIGNWEAYLRFEADSVRMEKELKTVHLLDHLQGKYQVAAFFPKNSFTRLVCFDSDSDDFEPVLNLITKIYLFGFIPLLEYTGRYFHIWIVFKSLIPNKQARELAKTILKGPHSQTQKIEIFPKNDTITRFGNAIILPLGRHRETKKFSTFLDRNTLKPLEIEDIKIALNNPVDKVHQLLERENIFVLEPCMEAIYQQGVEEGLRNYTCYQLVLRLKQQGKTREETFKILLPWVKKCPSDTHPFTVKELKQVIKAAYSGLYISKKVGCNHPLLKRHCIGKSNCFFYENLKRRVIKWKEG